MTEELKAKCLSQAIGDNAEIHVSSGGHYRVLYRDMSFCWFGEPYHNYRCWRRTKEDAPKYGGYDKCIGNFGTVNEVLEFLSLEDNRLVKFPYMSAIEKYIHRLKDKVKSFRLFQR